MTDVFKYEPLRKNEIRVCRVINAEPFECQLIHINFKQKSSPQYAALSYVWGDSTDTVPLICNGKVLQVTRTLRDSLLGTNENNQCDYIWADQLCIDQANSEERSSQVHNMATIYQGAKLVLIWLGHALADTGLAIEMIQLLKKAAECEATDQDRGYNDVWNRLELTRKYAQQANLPAFGDEKPWRALLTFYENPWFERLWVIQETLATNLRELGVNSRDDSQPAWAIIGEHRVSYLDIRVAADWAWNNGQKCGAHGGGGVDMEGIGTCYSTTAILKTGRYIGLKKSGRFRFDFLVLLQHFGSRKCADPRDKVYGLLGISDLHPDETKSMASLLDNAQAVIKIDYNRSVLEVYRETAKAIIAHRTKHFVRNYRGINLIVQAVPHSEEPGWPTWVPDWRLNKKVCNGSPIPLDGHWPGGDLMQRVHSHPDENVLLVEGIIFDEITWMHDQTHVGVVLFSNDPQRLAETVESQLGNCYQPSPFSRRESTSQAFVLTMTAGIVMPSLVPICGDEAEQIFADTFFDFVRAVKMPRTTQEERDARYAVLAKYNAFGYDTGWSTHPHRMLCSRRIFTTANGWLGLGLQQMEKGDVLAIIFGLNNISILRPRSDNPEQDGYSYIGEAYVRGASDGELVPTFPRDEHGNVIGTKIALR